ncbi:MAG: DnaJ domain-containing protein, partial [Vulcanimicrobiota bacterium]
MTKLDYYKILGVDKNSTKSDIKRAYKRLTRKYHPDIAENKEEAEIKFREINEAYSVLNDDEKRSMYDQFGHAGLSGGGSPFGGGYGGGFADMGGFGDIFDMFFDMGSFGGSSRRSRQRNRAVRGRDVRYDLEITLEEAYQGLEKEIELETYQTCPVCNGRRAKPTAGFKTCPTCNGQGALRSVQNTMLGQFVTTKTCPECQGEGQ